MEGQIKFEVKCGDGLWHPCSFYVDDMSQMTKEILWEKFQEAQESLNKMYEKFNGNNN